MTHAISPTATLALRARMRRYGRRTIIALPAAAISLFVSSLPAFADLKLCNRMSYVVEAAIGIDDKGPIENMRDDDGPVENYRENHDDDHDRKRGRDRDDD